MCMWVVHNFSFGLGCDMNNTGSGLLSQTHVASQGVMGLVVLLMKLHSAI